MGDTALSGAHRASTALVLSNAVAAAGGALAGGGGDEAGHAARCRSLWEEREEQWRARKAARLAHVRSIVSSENWQARAKNVFDPYEPEWQCDFEERVGKAFGDGGKFICGLGAVANGSRSVSQTRGGAGGEKPCLVYSIGCNLDTTFERAIINRTGGACEVHIFDPTVDASLLEAESREWGYKLHSIGLAEKEGEFSFRKKGVRRSYPAKTLPQMMELLGHTGREITMFKVDCEGCEFDAFRPIAAECAAGRLRIGQLQIEMHIPPLIRGDKANLTALETWFTGADACGLRLFHKERNHWGCHGWRCLEYAFVSRGSALTTFTRYHGCPADFLAGADAAAPVGQDGSTALSARRRALLR